jgi:adenosine 3'-phospho 5'-phosphosulfate transporter B2
MAARLARAGAEVRKHAAKGSRNVVWTKPEDVGSGESSSTPVTTADVASDAILRDGLDKSPFLVIDEESSAIIDRQSEGGTEATFTWIDPLDATREFSEGLDQYVSIMACLAHEGNPVAGLVYFPFLESCNDKRPGKGCLWGAYRHHPDVPDLDESSWVLADAPTERMAVSSEEKKASILRDRVVIMSRTQSHKATALNLAADVHTIEAGGTGYKIAKVLEGEAAAYVHTTHIKSWDLCAGDALLRASGGSLTDLRGLALVYEPSDPVLRDGVFGTVHVDDTERDRYFSPVVSRAPKKRKKKRKVHPGTVLTMVAVVSVLRLVLPKRFYSSELSSRSPKPASTTLSSSSSSSNVNSATSWKHLTFCALGIQLCYVTWGVVQERLMGHAYGVHGERFNYSSVLLLCNKVVSAMLAAVLLRGTTDLATSGLQVYIGRAPALLFAYASLSNGISSWCQYEALKHTIFPIVVVFKASKMIPVMVIGQLAMFARKYKTVDYAFAASIAFGVTLAILGGRTNSQSGGDAMTLTGGLVGVLLMLGYTVTDAFTSQWQGHLFRTYGVSSVQMMLATNTLSACILLFSVLTSGELGLAVDFALRHPEFGAHAAVLALSSASGQYFIFLTIKNHGPLKFATIMVLRNVVSTVVSSMLYAHTLPSQTILGFVWVFSTLLLNVWRKSRRPSNKK